MNPQTAIRDQIERRIAWYSTHATRSGRLFKAGKVVAILAAAAIPFCALLGAPPLVTAGLGALIAVIEGLQQLYRHHEHWLNYRAAAEGLQRELLLHDAQAGPYDVAALSGRGPIAVLAERTATLTEHEGAKWLAVAERAGAAGAPEPTGAGEPGSP